MESKRENQKEIIDKLNLNSGNIEKKKIKLINKEKQNIKEIEKIDLERTHSDQKNKEKKLKLKIRKSSIKLLDENKKIPIFHKQNTCFEKKEEKKTRNFINKLSSSENEYIIKTEIKPYIENKYKEENINLPLISGNNKNISNNNLSKVYNALNLTMKNSTFYNSSFKKSSTLNDKKIIKQISINFKNNNNNFLKKTNNNSTEPNYIPSQERNFYQIIKTDNNIINNNNTPNSNIKKTFIKIKTFTKENNIINNIKEEEEKKLQISDKNLLFPNYPQVRTSKHSINYYIKSFAVNSYQGLIRNYNEDKVSIILTIKKPKNFIGETWPKISYMAIFDGHGGNLCSNFLRDNLHNYIIKEENLINDTENALINSFEKAENDFINNIALKENDKSGSCALVCLIIDNKLYIANCGDSRAIISLNSGKENKLINSIHRPNNFYEKERIINNGGNIYISNYTMRIIPGRLSVTRAFGDINAKINNLGEKKNILISKPEVCKVNLKGNKIDFLIMGCDGIFECLSSEDCVNLAWKIMKEDKKNYNTLHEMNGAIVDLIIKSALKRNTSDNVTALFVSFRNFEKKFHEGSIYSNPFNSNNNLISINEDYGSDNNSKSNNLISKNQKTIKFNSFNHNINNENKNKLMISQNIHPAIRLKIENPFSVGSN